MAAVTLINEVKHALGIKRAEAFAAAEKRKRIIHAEIPEIASIDAELESTALKIYAAAMEKRAGLEERIQNIRFECEALKRRRDTLLAEHGYDIDYTQPQFECKDCDDTGYIKLKMCHCLKEQISKALYNASGMGSALDAQDFESFDTRYYKGQERESMEKSLARCREYAANFTPDKKGLLFMGPTGLGKTHLSSAIAKEVIKKGYTVVYDSAQNIFDTYEAKRFGREPDADTDKFQSCDLLIIDDLGAEHATAYTVPVFFNLLNYRTINKKAIIISTNLTSAEIRKKYESRILSRLLGDLDLILFSGNDIRLLKLRNSHL